jgi:periplasmic copper chaperone A
MKMRPLDGVEVPAGGTAEFSPGADHIMLIGLKAPLKAGDRFALTLRFEKAGEVAADVAVVAPGDIQGTGHGGHGTQ